MSATSLRSLAAVAHECWCELMREQGWSYGDTYSAEDQIHDALRPFDQLPIPDQRRCLRTLRCEGTAASLADLLDYPRDQPGLPELQPEDMEVGRRVVSADDPAIAGEIRGGIGRIISWTINRETGDLDLIRVRWDEGDETVHTPGECELMLLSEYTTDGDRQARSV